LTALFMSVPMHTQVIRGELTDHSTQAVMIIPDVVCRRLMPVLW
jgi:hypothetical protein